MHTSDFHAASLPDIPHDGNALRVCPKCKVLDRPARHVCKTAAGDRRQPRDPSLTVER